MRGEVSSSATADSSNAVGMPSTLFRRALRRLSISNTVSILSLDSGRTRRKSPCAVGAPDSCFVAPGDPLAMGCCGVVLPSLRFFRLPRRCGVLWPPRCFLRRLRRSFASKYDCEPTVPRRCSLIEPSDSTPSPWSFVSIASFSSSVISSSRKSPHAIGSCKPFVLFARRSTISAQNTTPPMRRRSCACTKKKGSNSFGRCLKNAANVRHDTKPFMLSMPVRSGSRWSMTSIVFSGAVSTANGSSTAYASRFRSMPTLPRRARSSVLVCCGLSPLSSVQIRRTSLTVSKISSS
mmetsp:Transcript_1549/g.4901  ORF Transcript_1549/g.4901 Transcript_1549/m.4901 type:complete len:293 (+) Transcript_1549:225-1103(+)